MNPTSLGFIEPGFLNHVPTSRKVAEPSQPVKAPAPQPNLLRLRVQVLDSEMKAPKQKTIGLLPPPFSVALFGGIADQQLALRWVQARSTVFCFLFPGAQGLPGRLLIY